MAGYQGEPGSSGDHFLRPMSEVKKEVISPEASFITFYQLNNIDDEKLASSAARCHRIISAVPLIPQNNTIFNYEIFTRPDFVGLSRDRDPQLFFEASLATGEFLSLLAIIQDKDIKFTGERTLTEIKDDWNDTKHCPLFQNVLRAGYGLIMNDQELINNNFTPETIQFLAKHILVQQALCQSRVLTAYVETIGKVFVFGSLAHGEECIKRFMENEKRFANHHRTETADGEATQIEDMQNYLELIQAIAKLYPGTSFVDRFLYDDKLITHYATDFVSPALFCAFLNLFTAFIKSSKLADRIYGIINKAISDIMNFKNFFDAIKGHANDLMACEIDHNKLNMDDSAGMEAVLALITALCKYNNIYAKLFTEDEDYREYDLVNSLLQISLSPVPATLKARCFDLLAALNLNLWVQIESTQLLTKDTLENKKGGIIGDILIIEVPSRNYMETRSFIGMIGSMMKYIDKTNFGLYESFLEELILKNIDKWVYVSLDNKWGLFGELCQCWIHALEIPNRFEICEDLYKHAITEQKFINLILTLISDDNCPQETLYIVFKFIYSLVQDEKGFLKHSTTTSRTRSASLVQQISWSSDSVVKMLKCVASTSKELQLISLNLIRYLCITPQSIVQVLLTKNNAKALQVAKFLVNNDESEDCEGLNVRCLFLSVLIELGSSSFFVRHVCGFDQHDPPTSIIQSNLSKGLLTCLIDKLCDSNTHRQYPIFTSLGLKVILLVCENDLSVGPVLNLLRSSLRSFFTIELSLLRNDKSSPISIGSFLQLLARESITTSDSFFTGTTMNAFKLLMTTGYRFENSKRSVLIFEFIDRVTDDIDSDPVAQGINDIAVAYLQSEHILKLMKENDAQSRSIWIQFIFNLLEKINELTRSGITQMLSSTAAIIAQYVIGRKIFGDLEQKDIETVFGLSLQAISHLYQLGHSDARLGIYSIIDNDLAKIQNKDQIRDIYIDFEQRMVQSIQEDSKSEIPILKSAAFSAAETLIPVASRYILKEFVEKSILEIDDEWSIYDRNVEQGSFSLLSKCSFLCRYVTSSLTETECRAFIDSGIIHKLSYPKFWKSISEAYQTSTTSSISEQKLKLGSKIFRLLAAIGFTFSKNQILAVQLKRFLIQFKDPFQTVLDYGDIFTLEAIDFLADLMCLLSTTQNSEVLIETGIAQRIPFTFRRYANEGDWQGNLRETGKNNINSIVSKETSEKAHKIIKRLLNVTTFTLTKLSEKEVLFSTPLFGDDWRSELITRTTSKSKPPLAVITSFLIRTIKDKVNTNKNVIEACLLLIYRQLDHWRNNPGKFDFAEVKRQSELFTKEPFSSYQGESTIEKMLLKKLYQFSSE